MIHRSGRPSTHINPEVRFSSPAGNLPLELFPVRHAARRRRRALLNLWPVHSCTISLSLSRSQLLRVNIGSRRQRHGLPNAQKTRSFRHSRAIHAQQQMHTYLRERAADGWSRYIISLWCTRSRPVRRFSERRAAEKAGKVLYRE